MSEPQSRESQVPLAILLLEGGQAAQDNLRDTLKATGLKPRHGQLLMRLSQGGATSQQDLLEELDLDPSVLVGLLNDLEAEGLVERVRDPADRRRHIVALSDKGAKAMQELQGQIADVEARLFAGISPDVRDVLRRALHSVCTGHRAAKDNHCG
ncbi:MAG: hypothetical protein QOG52_70 [Frankiaceae bacterium]|nr:hypothetical protein [Frankiaceae bacterium]